VGAFTEAPAELLQAAAMRVLEDDGRQTELSVTLVSDEAITGLNRQYLGRDRTTDVIAFSLGEDEAPLGDVYVCMDQARRQAADEGVSLQEELVRLLIHGALHVLGHDHPEGPDRMQSPMFVLQERIVVEVLQLRA